VVDADGSPHDLDSAATIAAPAALLDQLIPILQAADLTDSRDTHVTFQSPYAALDAILSRARYLIFEFDGPVADLAAAMPDAADQLRATLRAEGGELPPDIAKTSDPVEILAYAEGVSVDLAGRIDAQLSGIEVAAAGKARPAAYLHETFAACRDSGRTLGIVSRSAGEAVRVYLAKRGLAEPVRRISAVSGYPPGHLLPGLQLVEEVFRGLGAAPSECALISASATGIEAAERAGIASIGYATDPGTSERLVDAGAGCILPSLADLTLRLRARPLPN
jgi:beta-phosphoglucomutase-like phosphatase (HAD superfamily)